MVLPQVSSLLYQIKWHPTLLQKRHVLLFESQGHYGKHSNLLSNLMALS